jgi:stage II sporulation protein E
MALSDGMGSGEYAKKVSAAAISLIEAFYRAEMPTDTVLDTINKLICFNRDERFTCIDIAAINLNTLSAGFIKIGSPAGIIARKGEIKVLESNSLPLGILDSIHPTVSKEQLRDGDIVVFMSDGITSAFPSATDLYEFLGKQKALNPQSLADKILNGALARTGTPLDDMTVVCTRIYKRVDE